MKTSTHYKILNKITEENFDFDKNLGLKFGDFIISLNPFKPKHVYEESKYAISKYITECAKSTKPIIKYIYLGMACHYIFDTFSYAHNIYSNFPNDYFEHTKIEASFDRYINNHINKRNESEIITVVNNHFEPLSPEKSIQKLYEVYKTRCEVKYDEHSRNLIDFSFSYNICKLLIQNYL